jgi:hypothetical protein
MTGGAVIAAFQMAAGVDVFGTISKLVASWFLSPEPEVVDSELAEIERMLAEIREQQGHQGAKI